MFQFLDSLFAFLFLLFLVALSLSRSSLLSLKTLSPRTWIIIISSSWQSFSSAGIVCFSSWLEIAKYLLNSLFNYDLTSLISRSKRGLQIICLRAFTSSSPREALVKPWWNAKPCARDTLHLSSALEYVNFNYYFL